MRGLAGKSHAVEILDRSAASVVKVSEALAGKRYAHLATHGFYDGKRFDEEEQRRLRWLVLAWIAKRVWTAWRRRREAAAYR